MHEVSYALSLLELLEQSAQDRGLRRVTAVEVVMGELSGLAPEALEFAFTALAPGRGPLLAEARLVIRRRPARARCSGCGAEFAVSVHGLACPSCGGGGAHMYQGDEFLLASYEGER